MTGDPVLSTEMAVNAERVDFTSRVNGRAYRLFISIPAAEPPAEGHSVVYLIDGNLHFGIAVDTARIQSRWPDVRDPVVVGIGYPTDSVATALKVRNLDLTSPATDAYLSSGWLSAMNSKAEDYGRVDDYLRVIEEEVKPRVAESVKIDHKDSVLMGHSLGGLTTLHALFRNPSAFQQYVAISPSIWWNNCAVLGYEQRFAELAQAGRVNARVLVSAGADEAHHRYVPGLPANEDTMRSMADDCRMVLNVQELGTRLSRMRAPGLTVETVVHEGDDHNMVPAAGIARGIMFSMRRKAKSLA